MAHDTYDYTDPRNDCAAMEASSDWVQFVLDKPMAAKPDSTFVYSSGVTMVLAEILEQVTGRKLAEYAETELFAPLGIKAHYSKLTPTGLPDAEGGLYLAPRDLARIAKLYLDGGQVEGRQLVPRDWVRESLEAATASGGGNHPVWGKTGYGYQWWVYTDYLGQSAWGGSGYGDQLPVVVPGLQRVFASPTRWRVVRGGDLEEGESQGLPVWSRHIGDPILASNLTRRVDFALFMVAALENDSLIHEPPAIVGCRTPSALALAGQVAGDLCQA